MEERGSPVYKAPAMCKVRKGSDHKGLAFLSETVFKAWTHNLMITWQKLVEDKKIKKDKEEIK